MPWGVLRFVDSFERLHFHTRVYVRGNRKSRNPKTGKAQMEDSSLCESFLDLPPEVRNRIYTFASSPRSRERCCVVPSLALAQTCRQLRYEYRPICLRAHVTIDWRDVPVYLRTFFPTQNGKIADIRFAPEGMTIFTNTYYKKDLSRTEVQIDLVPLLMMGLVNQKFKCDFKYEPRSREATSLDMDIHTMMAADVNTLQKLLTHRQVDWLRDVISGRVSRLLISHIGTNNYPRARFFIGPVKDNQLLSEFTQHNRKEMKLPSPYPVRSPGMEESRLSLMSPNLKNGYVGHVELRKVFIENDYIFLWDVEWEGAEQEAGASFFLE